MNRNVKLCESPFDALPLRRLDESACQTCRSGEDHRTWNGVDGGQGEDWRIVMIEGGLMIIVMLDQGVRRHVAVHHDLRVPMIFAFVDVLGRGDR